jgi:hypothetical protein
MTEEPARAVRWFSAAVRRFAKIQEWNRSEQGRMNYVLRMRMAQQTGLLSQPQVHAFNRNLLFP